jgi:hypothetical protein
MNMKVLVACEESQAVCIAFRVKGHEAYSCDILPCSGGHPEWHLQMDVFEAIKLKEWDIMIAFPPCTRLTVTANKWYKAEYRKRFPFILEERESAVYFFLVLANSGIEKIAIENPVGIMSTRFRKPDQIIQPWQFGDKAVKKTCLWLKGLSPLLYTQIVTPEYKIFNSSTHKSGKSKYPVLWTGKHNAKERSKTFPGIAKAMAEQWG